jgi:hypothetical protein
MSATDPEQILLDRVHGRAKREHISMAESWRVELNRPRRPTPAAAEANTQARDRAFAEVELSLQQSSIAQTKPGRRIPDTPAPEKQPGESDADYYRRVREQVAKLGARANTYTAKPVDAAADSEAKFAEPVGGRLFADRKAQLLASAEAQDREITSHGTVVGAADTSRQKSAALAAMRSRGESVDPRSLNFAERYKQALKATT